MTDPAVRADGLCACGCGKPLVRTKQARKYAGAHLDRDPFATSRCARRYHGCETEADAGLTDAELEQRSAQGRVGKANYTRRLRVTA